MVAKAATKAGEFYCFHCGKKVLEKDPRCRNCGMDFDRTVDAFRCPRCSNLLPVGAAACPGCGLGFKVRHIDHKPKSQDETQFIDRLIQWSDEEDGTPETEAVSPPKKTRIVKARPSPPPPPPPSGDEEEKPLESRDEPEILPKMTPEDKAEEEIAATGADQKRIEVPTAPSDNASQGLSVQVMKKLLEDREKQLSEYQMREEELAKREEQLKSEMDAYVANKKEREILEGRMKPRSEAAEISDEMDDQVRAEWMRDQSKIKMGLIEIRNQIGSKRSSVDFYPSEMSGDLLEKIEVLEERIADTVRERNELSNRLNKMEAVQQDVRTLLKILDRLLGKLPPTEVDEFSRSKDFKLYEKVMDELNI